MSALSEAEIQKCMRDKQIFINPFNAKNLNSSSYDLTLGKYFYRVAAPEASVQAQGAPIQIHNPYGKSSEAAWKGYYSANTLEELGAFGLKINPQTDNVSEKDFGIILPPGETILAHTSEFFGCKAPFSCLMTTFAPISLNMIDVSCQWGDTDYVDRWPLRITNLSKTKAVLLVVGQKIATVSFFGKQLEVNALTPFKDTGALTGGVSSSDSVIDIKLIVSSWNPSMILPTLFVKRNPQPQVRQQKHQQQAVPQAAQPQVAQAPPQVPAVVQQGVVIETDGRGRRKRAQPASMSSAVSKSLKLPEPQRDGEGNPILPALLKGVTTKDEPKNLPKEPAYNPDSV